MKIGFSKTLNYFYLGAERIQLSLRRLVSDLLTRTLLIILVVLNLVLWCGVYFLRQAVGPDLAVLHYNVIFGIDLIGSATSFYVTPMVGLLILLINVMLAALALGIRERLLAVMLISAAIVGNFFCLIAIYFAYLINFS